jgi:hypothetical protein
VRVMLVALFLLLSNCCVFAQSPNGSIRGIVLDSDAKSIAGAEVIVVNDATGVKYVTSTNAEGLYAVENLPPGPYRIQVSKFGFKGIIKPDIVLNVQDALSLNFTLPIGASSVTVTVEGGAPFINTTDASVSTVVDRQFAENLPLNGRSFQTLIYLTPGVVATPSTASDSGQFSVNGQRAAANYWMVDGVSANVGIGAASSTPGNGFGGTLGSFSAMGGTNSLVSVDAMQEFRLQTSTYAPEFGRTPGGQISIVTRSGTNGFHGTAFDYVRNDMFDANNWFANSKNLAKPRERQNDFGGTLSGPLRRDRSFFFFSYEGLRLRLPETALSNVPDVAAREAALPSVQPYLNGFPVPNGIDNTATGVAQFNASFSNPASLDAYSIRIDHKVSGQLSVFGRYNYSPSEFVNRGTSAGVGALNDLQRFRIVTQTGTVGATWNITSVLSNDLRFNYSHVSANSNYYMDMLGGGVPFASLNFPDSFTAGNSLFDSLLLSLGVGEALVVGKGAQNGQRQFNLVDGVALQKGSHSLKFGVDFRRLSPEFDPSQYAQTAVFGTVPQSQVGSTEFANVASQRAVTILFRNLGLYAQDTWRATSCLSLTYGLRWDLDVAPESLNGPSIPSVTGYNLMNFSGLGFAQPGTPPFRTTYGNVAPRIGAAYQFSKDANWQTVARAGFGVFYDLVSAEAGGALAFQAPPIGNTVNFFGATYPFSPAQSAPPPIPTTATLAEFSVFNPQLKLPYTLQWNLSLEQSIGQDQVVSVSYIGASGRRLLQSTVIVNPPSNTELGTGVFVDNTASSEYNALQVQFRRRIHRGVQALASYTWAHSIDDASAGSFGNASNFGGPGGVNQNRGSSDFDIRHTVTAGVTIDIPSPKKSAVARALLGGWSTENFLLARSAAPLDLNDVNFFELNGGIETAIRPDVVPGQPFYLYGQQYPGGRAINPAAFTDPPADPVTQTPTRQGNLGRNALRGFGATQWDFAAHRDFRLRESVKLQFRAELFNVLNHPNFGPPDPSFGAAGFGISKANLAQSLASGSLGAGGFSPLYQIGGPRSVQLALKLFF